MDRMISTSRISPERSQPICSTSPYQSHPLTTKHAVSDPKLTCQNSALTSQLSSQFIVQARIHTQDTTFKYHRSPVSHRKRSQSPQTHHCRTNAAGSFVLRMSPELITRNVEDRIKCVTTDASTTFKHVSLRHNCTSRQITPPKITHRTSVHHAFRSPVYSASSGSSAHSQLSVRPRHGATVGRLGYRAGGFCAFLFRAASMS